MHQARKPSCRDEVTMFSGVFTAIITPFRNGQIDETALELLIERQISAGVSGLVPCGTTGESVTLSDTELLRVIEKTIQVVDGRCTVIAGVRSNNTQKTIELGKKAMALGADSLLVITPYYNKPTQAGLFAHFTAVSDAIPDAKIMLYNVPGRTGVSLSVDTIVRLAEIPNIVALKEATGDMAFAARIAASCGDRLALLSGDDATALPLWSVGGQGVVSVTSNLLPKRMVDLWEAFQRNGTDAQRMHLNLMPLFDGLFIETNPAPVKTLVAQHTGLCTADMRCPMVPLLESSQSVLRALCQRLEIELVH